MNFGEISRRNAQRYPNKTALIFENSRYTFKQFNDRVNRLANALSALNMSKGDKIAILSEGCNQYVEICCAAAKIGLVAAPINPSLPTQQISYLINNADATTLAVADEYKEVAASLKPELPVVKNFIVIGSPWGEMRSYEQLISSYPAQEPHVEIDENELYYLACTSGTTGVPKQIMCTHRNLWADAVNNMLIFHLEHHDIALQANPLHWGRMVPWLIEPYFYMGCTTVITREPEVKLVLDAISKEKITVALLSSSFIASIIEHPELDKCDLSSLRSIGLIGMHLPEEVLRKAIKKMGKIFCMMYGTTEIPFLTYMSPDEIVLEGPPEKLRRLHSCGRNAAPIDAEMRVIDEEGRDIAPGEIGEVIGRGDHMMSGYWKMPQATEEVMRDGYFHTGDLATTDDEGYLYFLDRKKDSIISEGKLVPSIEVETILYRHPSILEAAIIGVPDEKLGETLKAIVVLKEGEQATAEEIIGFCTQNLDNHAVPKSVDFINKLPRSPSGKVLKHQLRRDYGTPKTS